MAFLEAKSNRIRLEEAGDVDPQRTAVEDAAYQDWKRARLDFESIHLIWDAAQRLGEQAESANRAAA